MLPIAVMVTTPGSVCVERQGPRPANRTVPENVVVKQRQAMVDSHWTLKAEGFPEVVFSDSVYRLLPFLERLSGTRQAGFGLDGSDGLGELNLVRRAFGEEILPLWRWKPGSNVAGGDRVAQIRLGQQYLTLALRTGVDGEGDIGFGVMVPCPHDDECTGRAWVPAYSVTCLFRALNGDLDDDEAIVCTVHGPTTPTRTTRTPPAPRHGTSKRFTADGPPCRSGPGSLLGPGRPLNRRDHEWRWTSCPSPRTTRSTSPYAAPSHLAWKAVTERHSWPVWPTACTPRDGAGVGAGVSVRAPSPPRRR
ncbi:hypothetical protein ACH4VQ_36005 [Streptomyces anulatus]